MDLLPETEQLHIIKIGTFGFPRSVLSNVKDLIKIEVDEDTEGNVVWIKSRLWTPREDRFMLFKDIKTGEIFSFNRKGIWNENGINHPLIK